MLLSSTRANIQTRTLLFFCLLHCSNYTSNFPLIISQNKMVFFPCFWSNSQLLYHVCRTGLLQQIGKSSRAPGNTGTGTHSGNTSWKASTGSPSTGTTRKWPLGTPHLFGLQHTPHEEYISYGSQTQLYLGWWDGFRKDHPVNYIPLWDVHEEHRGALPGHSTPLHHSQLGEGIPDLDSAQRGGLPREPGQPQDHPGLWDVLQRCTGEEGRGHHEELRRSMQNWLGCF